MRVFLLTVAFILGGFFIFTDITFAALVPCDGPTCQTCDLVKLANNILKFLVEVMVVAGALTAAFAGFQMVFSGGDEHAISHAKEMLTNVVVGFVILFSAWLIVDTVMKMFVNESVLVGPWHQIQCAPQPTLTEGQPGTLTTGTQLTGTYNDMQARKILADNGISVNKTAVQGTSLFNIRAATLQDMVDLKKDCKCEIVITGGTESTGGHAPGTESHSNGYKYDVRPNDTLNSFITKTYTNVGVRSDGATMYKAPDGSIYAREGDHWDVKVPG